MDINEDINEVAAADAPADNVAQYNTSQLVAIATDCAQQLDDALWITCVLELATRCHEPAVAQQIAVDKVALALLALDLRMHKKKRQVARWQALTAFAQSGHAAALQAVDHADSASASSSDSALQQLTSAAGLQAVLRLAHADRFGAKDVVAAMAQCVVVLALLSDPQGADMLAVTLADGDSDDDDGCDCSFSFLSLLKQLYVTLHDFALRQGIVDALLHVVASRDHAKAVVRAGVLRALLQVALDSESGSVVAADAAVDDDGSEPPAGSCLRNDLMLNCAKVLTHVAAFVCYASPPPPSSTASAAPPPPAPPSSCGVGVADRSSERFVCELVVALMLSGVSLVVRDGVRLLQMLIESPRLRTQLVTVMDLRGALEKTDALAQSERSLGAQDQYVAMLAQQQLALLRPEIDAHERALGASLVGLPADASCSTTTTADSSEPKPEVALARASDCKERGNWFFRRGNFPTARAFYRRAIALLRMAQLAHEQALAALTPAQVLRACSAGASVQVLSRSRRVWRRAMVSDVDDGRVEVIYDDDNDNDDDDESVEPSRVRLSMPTRVLESFDALEADCAMNMGKALAQLYDHARAVECFSHALRVPRNAHTAAALYHRGVAYLALPDLKSAQQDLWRANELARKRGDKSLLKLVTAAYKKLQALHSSKKRADKKLIKQMVNYLSTIPAIQSEQL